MAERRRDIEIALKARDQYSAELRKADKALSGFAAAQAKTQARRNLLSNAKKEIDATAEAYNRASTDAQRYAKVMVENGNAAKLSAAEQRELRDAFTLARDRSRELKTQLAAQRTELHRLKGATAGAMKTQWEKNNATNAGSAAAREQTDALGQNAVQLRRLKSESDGAAAAQKRLGAQLRSTTAMSRGSQGDFASRTADAYATRQGRGPLGLRPYELTNLSYQINDVVSGLAMGQAPMQIFAQQAGQIIQIFPKIGAAIFRLAPALAVLAPFFAAFARIKNEAATLREFEQGLILTGDTALYSAEKLAEIATAADRAGASLKDAKAAVDTFVKADFSQSQIEDLVQMSMQLAKATGTELPEAAEKLRDAFKGGVDTVRELDTELNFLSSTQYELIRSLSDAGRETEAMRIAQEALAERLDETAEKGGAGGPWAQAFENLGRAWGNLIEWLRDTVVVEGAIALLDGLGRAAAAATGLIADALASNSVEIPPLEVAVAGASDSDLDAEIAYLQSEIAQQELLIEVSPFLDQTQLNEMREELAYLEKIRAIPEGDRADPLNIPAYDQAVKSAEDWHGQMMAIQKAHEAVHEEGERRKKLDIDIGAIIKDQLGDMAEEQRLAEMTARERAIEEQLMQARNAAMERAIELGIEFLGLTEAQTAAIREQAGAMYDRSNPAQASQFEAQYTASRNSPQGAQQAELVAAAVEVAKRLGVNAKDILTAISYETGGTLDPWKAGPTTQWGQHRGLIQWGEPQQRKYGVTKDMAVGDQVRAAGRYLQDAGVKAGDGLLQIYAAINAGNAKKIHASDANNGGAPGTVLDKVNDQMTGHKARAEGLLAAYSGVRVEAEKSYDTEVKRAETARDFHETKNRELADAAYERSLSNQSLVDRQVALAIREAEREAQEAGTQLTAEQRAEVERITREKYTQKSLDEDRNASLKQAKQLEADVALLKEKRDFLEDQGAAAMKAGDQEGAEEAARELELVNQQLDEAIQKAIAFWEALGGEGSAAAIQSLQILQAELGQTKATSEITGESLNQMITGAAVSAFDRFAQAIANGENGLEAFKDAFMQMAGEILIQIGQMILKQLIFNAISGMFGGMGLGGKIAGGINGMLFHEGGIVGSPGAHSGTKTLAPGLFANAARYHEGGIAGLKPNEVPAVLEKGEEVLTEDDPRHRKNGGTGEARAGRPMNVVNALDAPSFLDAALANAAGGEVFLNYIRANKDSVKAVLG